MIPFSKDFTASRKFWSFVFGSSSRAFGLVSSSSRALVEGVVIQNLKAWMATAGPAGLPRHDEPTPRLFFINCLVLKFFESGVRSFRYIGALCVCLCLVSGCGKKNDIVAPNGSPPYPGLYPKGAEDSSKEVDKKESKDIKTRL